VHKHAQLVLIAILPTYLQYSPVLQDISALIVALHKRRPSTTTTWREKLLAPPTSVVMALCAWAALLDNMTNPAHQTHMH
jgi:hypothetical protein